MTGISNLKIYTESNEGYIGKSSKKRNLFILLTKIFPHKYIIAFSLLP